MTGSIAIGSNSAAIVSEQSLIVNTSDSMPIGMSDISRTDEDSLGNYIEGLRLKRGLTQTQLGNAVEISQKTISDIELSKTTFSRLSNFRKLADFFGVPIEELIIRAGLADSSKGATRLVETLIPASTDDPRDTRACARDSSSGSIRMTRPG